MDERVALSIIIVEELSTIILHYAIHVRFNSHNFYFRDANGTSLKVSSLSLSLSVTSFIIRIVTLAYFISSTSTATTNLLFFFLIASPPFVTSLHPRIFPVKLLPPK